MKIHLHILVYFILFGTLIGNSFGYLRVVEASFCMDVCAQYYLEEESGSYSDFFTNQNNLDLSLYVNRYVEIVPGEEYQCVECNATIIEDIQISDACDYPFSCFADPCEVADECQLNTPVECISNFCGGCNADFYDMDGNFMNCYNDSSDDCVDLSGIFFGVCEMFMGYAYINGECIGVSGCGWIIDGIDYSDAFYNSFGECQEACDYSDITCSEIEYEYSLLHTGDYITCSEDSDCVSIWGDCDVGLGGCHYSVNLFYDYDQSNILVNQWLDSDCMQWVCDCMPLPNSICNNGQCDLTYCEGSNPSGCFDSGCQDGYECMDFGNSEYAEFCVSSTCVCDENYFYESYWACTDDCNGGTCVAEVPQPGDLCVVEETSIGGTPGFVECDGQCVEYMYYSWVGDGWCDEGAWGITLNCEALDCDGGDCQDSWCGCTAGDTNNDGTTDIIDIVLIINCILDGDNSCACADLNFDDQIDVVDIILIVNQIINN